jgi:hypothetical protein
MGAAPVRKGHMDGNSSIVLTVRILYVLAALLRPHALACTPHRAVAIAIVLRTEAALMYPSPYDDRRCARGRGYLVRANARLLPADRH